MSNSIDAFVALSQISAVNGIGIGSGINEDYLEFFDNTALSGSSAVPLPDVLADFSSAGDLNPLSAWTKSGDSSGTMNIGSSSGNSFLILLDSSSGSGPAVATSNGFVVDSAVDGQATLSFDYQTDNYGGQDYFRWTLERSDGVGGWVVVESNEEPQNSSGWQGVEIAGLANGTYRFVFEVENGSGQSDLVRIDNIELNILAGGPTGEPVVVNTASELEAALQGGSSSVEPNDAGNDVIVGGGENDLFFGDALNTDALADAQSLTLPEGSGWARSRSSTTSRRIILPLPRKAEGVEATTRYTAASATTSSMDRKETTSFTETWAMTCWMAEPETMSCLVERATTPSTDVMETTPCTAIPAMTSLSAEPATKS
jgi:hypothetical protein